MQKSHDGQETPKAHEGQPEMRCHVRTCLRKVDGRRPSARRFIASSRWGPAKEQDAGRPHCSIKHASSLIQRARNEDSCFCLCSATSRAAAAIHFTNFQPATALGSRFRQAISSLGARHRPPSLGPRQRRCKQCLQDL